MTYSIVFEYVVIIVYRFMVDVEPEPARVPDIQQPGSRDSGGGSCSHKNALPWRWRFLRSAKRNHQHRAQSGKPSRHQRSFDLHEHMYLNLHDMCTCFSLHLCIFTMRAQALVSRFMHGHIVFYTQAEVNRLEAPYGDCIKPKTRDALDNLFQDELPLEYSSAACYKTCYQVYVIRECNCADPQFPISGTALGNFTGASCDVRNVTQGKL